MSNPSPFGPYALASLIFLIGAVIAVPLPWIGLPLMAWVTWQAATLRGRRRRAEAHWAAEHRRMYGW